MDKKKLSTFSYKLVQISPIMILVNSGAFLSISSWFSELTELIFVMIPYISSTGYPPTTQGIMGHVQVANMAINEAETSRASVLLKESAISEASLAGRKPADLGKATLFFLTAI